MNDIDRWEQADELYIAVDKFADAALRESFRAAKGEYEFWSIKLQMYLSLYDKLAASELEAFGIMLLPMPGNEIVGIPRHIFTERPIVNDCDQNIVSTITRKYELVRVREFDNQTAGYIGTLKGDELKPGKRGPKSLDTMIADAIRFLEGDDALLWERPQEKRIEAIRNKAAEMNPGRFPNKARPGRTTVHRYLKKSE